MDGLQAFDYDQCIVGNKTPGDNAYGEDMIEFPKGPEGSVPCLTRVEIESVGSATDGDVDKYHLSTVAGSAVQDIGDATCVVKIISDTIIAIQPKKQMLIYEPVAPIPLTKLQYYFGMLVQHANEVKYRLHFTFRFIKGLKPARDTITGQF